MKSFAGAFQSHLEQDTSTLCTIWTITRVDTQVFRFTDHIEDITYGGNLYESAVGYTAAASRSSADLAVDNTEASGIIDSNGLDSDDLRAGLFDYAKVDIRLINYADPDSGYMILRTGTIGEISIIDNQQFKSEIRGLAQQLQQSVGGIYSAGCPADLGDVRCGVALGPLTVTGSVTTVLSNGSFNDTARTESNGYFTSGLLTWTSGLNSGRSMEVKKYVVGQIDLFSFMPDNIQVGDSYSVYPGCDKSWDTCQNTFTNADNFRGFPHIPGQDEVLKFGGQ